MTTRKERNKQLHEELARESKGTLFARRKLNDNPQTNEENSYQETKYQGNSQENLDRNSYQQSYDSNQIPHPGDYQHSGNQKSGWNRFGNGGGNQPPRNFSNNSSVFKPKKGKKAKKKKRHPILSVLLKVLVVLIVYCVGAFTLGKVTADQQTVLSEQEAKAFNGVTSSDGSHNILLLGSDSREGETARADTIMVLNLDGPSHKPKLVSFMRDTLVDIPGYGQTKLNAAYAYGGAELVRQTLSQNFGVDCKYYTIVDFLSFESVIDTLFPKGVEIDAEKDMSAYIDVAITAGNQMMDGHTLLNYARFRMDEEGDFGRVRRQQQVMNAIFSGMKNPVTLAKLPYAAGKVMGEAATDLPVTFLLKNTFSLVKGVGGVDRLSVPIDDSWSYGTDDYGGSVLVVDQEQNQQAVASFLSE
ncbi:LCP family protein [Enterococcus sp. 2201sp1_2201st1_B8_2201SCRN_220225]|uniref:LCP family protein n=1 Tax=unclassified Enterococcus TaxID=2608891 RepID=UPI0034A2B658